MKNGHFDPIIQEDVENFLKLGGSQFGNCAILGSNGMLGSYLLDFISAVNLIQGSNAVTYGFSRTKNSYISKLALRPGVVLTEISNMRDILNTENVHVIHAASPASVNKVVGGVNSLIESNIQLTTMVQSYLEKIGGHFTFFSSGEVYGISPPYPTRENDYSVFDHLELRGYYPEVKKYAELQSKIWFENTDIPVSILRIFHTFGPGVHRDDTRIFASAIYDIAENRDIKLNSDGSAMRSFLYTSDLASAIQISSYQTGFQVYNVCGSEEISILKFANLVARNSTTCKVVPNSIPEVEQNKRSPIMRGIANTSRLSNLGWKPRVDIETAIDKTIRSLEWRKS